MRVAIYGRYIKDTHFSFVKKLLQKLYEAEVSKIIVFENISEKFIEYDEKKQIEIFSTHTHLCEHHIDFLFSLGGDGSLLDTLTLVKNSGIPIIGINMGRLGFLSGIQTDEIEEAIEAIKQKKYYIDERTLLSVSTKNNDLKDTNFALNEVTINNAHTSSMLTVHVYINNEFLNSYWADGLIISTPTGSTAYSLSCGGPIILPDSSNFIINPIAPHNLNVRPLVIPDSAVLKLIPESRQGKVLLSLDSRSITVNNSEEITISKEKFTIKLLRLNKHSFLTTLRNKLKWGTDSRN